MLDSQKIRNMEKVKNKMGMLYYACNNCNGCIGIFGHFIGFIFCEDCKKWIHKDKGHLFQKHIVKCPVCSFTVSFESMGDEIETRCIKCDCKMHEGIISKNSKSFKKDDNLCQ